MDKRPHLGNIIGPAHVRGLLEATKIAACVSNSLRACTLPEDTATFTAIDLIPDFGYPGSDAGCNPWQPGPMLPNAAKCSPKHPNAAQCSNAGQAAQRNRSKSALLSRNFRRTVALEDIYPRVPARIGGKLTRMEPTN